LRFNGGGMMITKKRIIFTLLILIISISPGCINEEEKNNSVADFTIGFDNLTNNTTTINIFILNENSKSVLKENVTVKGKYNYETISMQLEIGKYNISLFIDDIRNLSFEMEISEYQKYGAVFEITDEEIKFGPKISS